ncbi:unnamed protein product, partial [Mesorhabditis spiculigera]
MTSTIVNDSMEDITVQYTFSDGSKSALIPFTDVDVQRQPINGSQCGGAGPLIVTVYRGAGDYMVATESAALGNFFH